jgi:hypothetical protein
VCIRYRGNVFSEPLPSNNKGIFTEPLSSNDKGIFTEPLPSNDKVGYTDTHTYSNVILKAYFIFLAYFPILKK